MKNLNFHSSDWQAVFEYARTEIEKCTRAITNTKCTDDDAKLYRGRILALKALVEHDVERCNKLAIKPFQLNPSTTPNNRPWLTLTLAGIFMSTENEDQDLTEAELSDVFNEIADTFDKEAGRNQPEPSIADEEDEELLAPSVSETQEPVNAQPEPAADEFDFNSLPPAAQKKIQDLQAIEHKYKSDQGRVSALQKQLDAQQQQLEQLQAKGQGDSAAAQKLEEKIEETEGNLDGLLEELPELAGLVSKFDKQIKALTEKVNESNGVIQEKVIAPSVAAEQEAAEEKEVKAIRDAHSDLPEIVSNPAFNNWVSKQHPAVAALFHSSSSADVIAGLDLYKQANPTSSPPPTNKINRDIDDMISLPRNGAANNSSVDESSAFEWAADQIARKKL